jgi:hypothetical protein
MGMKKIILAVGVTLLMAANANGLTLTFSDKDYLGGASWGTMTILEVNSNTLSIQYDASPSSIIPAGAQVTGFGFAPNLGDFSISNPDDGDFSWDQNGLTWKKLTNLNPIPTPENADEFGVIQPTKDDFKDGFGATEGNANNITPPGILPGSSDIFYLNFAGTISSDLIQWAGIRLQSLPGSINGGSLFLAGSPVPVPEPSMVFVFGTGLLALVGISHRRKN